MRLNYLILYHMIPINIFIKKLWRFISNIVFICGRYSHFWDDSNKISETKKFLNENFEVKDLRLANVIFGIKISRILEGITFSQPYYAEKLLKNIILQNISM